MTLKANVQVQVGADLVGAASVGEASHKIAKSIAQSFADGAGLNQADQLYSSAAQLAASAVDSLDLTGTLTNDIGQAVALARVKAIVFEAAVGNQGTITLGGNANPFASFLGGGTETIVIKPGGVLVLVAPDAGGYAVTAGTGDILDITNDDGVNTADYIITIIGAES